MKEKVECIDVGNAKPNDNCLEWQRAVIKVGSALIAPDGNRCSTKYLLSLADFIHHSIQQGKQIILVSSGSVAAGSGIMHNQFELPLTIPQKQALAAIGQSQVMQHWQRLFDDICAQILLTRSDLESAKRLINARNTIETLIEMKALPIINENDSVVVDELVVGDNDNLAAQVAEMCQADLLIICSDVDGLFDSNPKLNSAANLICEVSIITDEVMKLAADTTNPVATGGMITKLQAAKYANSKGIEALIVNGKRADTFDQLKRGKVP
ncbi:MAG: glutamate 5-kinase, partial [Kangiellaceae bacterium]|nr:glutamate 5-kinase [Kangiellaceae bacterium]